MTQYACSIQGGDYASAGSASKALKEQLKRIGLAPSLVRRVMIAAYEAEMNVVIHGGGGLMRWSVEDGQIAVEVTDKGPGIADIDLAMREGHSTAPATARALGFGAGMGLPNIRRNTDRFSIESVVGQGTRLRFAIRLHPADVAGHRPNSLHLDPSLCTHCLKCIHACPTAALRVRGAGPTKLDHLCIDCTSCIAACPAAALSVTTTSLPASLADVVLVFQPALLMSMGVSIRQVAEAMQPVGSARIMSTGPAEQALAGAAMAYARENADDGPVISPVCPAVLNLIETRFPALIGHVAPFLSPLEAVRESLIGRRAAFVVLCPAQKTLLSAGRGPATPEAIAPAALASAMHWPLPAARKPEPPTTLNEAQATPIRITGMRAVIQALEEIENGDRTDRHVLELYACAGGCGGSALLGQAAATQGYDLAAPALGASGVNCAHGEKGNTVTAETPSAARREIPLTARAGLRLDENMSVAMAKLSHIERLVRQLPGANCGLCGSPTCAAFAEDVVLERAKLAGCTKLEKLLP